MFYVFIGLLIVLLIIAGWISWAYNYRYSDERIAGKIVNKYNRGSNALTADEAKQYYFKASNIVKKDDVISATITVEKLPDTKNPSTRSPISVSYNQQDLDL